MSSDKKNYNFLFNTLKNVGFYVLYTQTEQTTETNPFTWQSI